MDEYPRRSHYKSDGVDGKTGRELEWAEHWLEDVT